MGSCLCDGPADCKNCKMPEFGSFLVKVISKDYVSEEKRDKVLKNLGFEKVKKNAYAINL